MNNSAERDVMCAFNRINAKLAEESREFEKAAKHHARVEALCAVASVLLVQGVALFFLYQLMNQGA